MFTYTETLDPNEVRSFAQAWGDELSDGEAINANPTVTFVEAAGTTQPTAASFASQTTLVWLTGGTPGATALFTVRVTTSQQRTLERAYAVRIVETTFVPPAETEVERLTREIAEAKAQRALVATGQAVIDVWRDGRRIRKMIPTLAELEAHIRQLEGELYTAQLAAGIDARPRRSAIDLAWGN
jgi:hypothetical protein